VCLRVISQITMFLNSISSSIFVFCQLIASALQAAQLKRWAAARFALEAALAVNPSNVIALEVSS
jgi:hypothetical protein